MQKFFIGFLLLVLAVVAVLGFRGKTSRKPPLEIFPDMDRQPKVRPQEPSAFFQDGRSSRLPVPGTVARGDAYQDLPENTGFQPGTTNWVETIPVRVTAQLLARGRERYQIYCAPCHGALGDGKGITSQFGMAVVANLHDKRIVTMRDGELFHVITHGRSLMGAYGGQIPTEDRWAIIGYLRALHLSRLAAPEDLPEEVRAKLK